MNIVDERIFKIPPKKVVKANKTYTSQYSQEISFSEGDFFYVIDEDDLYYSIINPAEKLTGLVPKIFCDALDKVVKRNTENYTYNNKNRSQYRAEFNNRNKDNYYDNDEEEGIYTVDSSDVPQDQIFTTKVLDCRSIENNRFQITIEIIKHAKNKKLIIKRLYDDLYAMQIILLKLFQKEAGRVEKYERILPFIPPAPPQNMNINNPIMEKYKSELNSYLKEMTRMPFRIQNSFPVKRFFLLRTNDIETYLPDKYNDYENENDDYGYDNDNDDDFLDLIADYDEEILILKIIFQNEPLKMEISDKITFKELWEKVEDFLDIDVVDIYFKDEENYEIPLLNDIDLGNFLRTRRYRLLLYVE